MKNLWLTSLICSIIAIFSFSAVSQTTDLFISEYGEGSSNNKYIEIYNGTGADVDLTDYVVKFAFNGSSSWPTTEYDLAGTLVNGDVYILAYYTASSLILAEADLTTTSSMFNGNDAVGLFSSSSLIDIIGVLGIDPGTNKGWEVAGTTNATINHTLVRKSTVCSPNTDWASSAGTDAADSEWIVYDEDDWTHIGSHTSACGGVPTPINAIWLVLLFAFSFIVIKRVVK